MNEPAQPALKAQRGLLKSSGVVSAMTMLSRVFGLARDMVIAYFFGSSAGADSFFLAFRIPNFFRRLFGEGAFSQAFVPVLTEYRSKRTAEEVKDLVDKVSGTLGVNLVIITLLGVVGAQVVISIFAAGFVYNGQAEKLDLATDMLRLTFPYLMLISLTAFAGGILNSFGRFAIPAFTPVLLNLSLILCAVYLRPWLETPVMALAWAVLIAGVAQLTFQLPFLARIDLLPRPKVDFKDEGVRKILTLMLPALFGVSVGQINLLLDTVLASFLETGSLSWLYYSDRLLELPLALFGITIATVILPSLSREHADESPQEFGKTLDWAIRMVFLIGVPASIALVLLSESLITTLFYQGEMTRRDVTMASLSLGAYGVGLLGHMLVKVLAPGYFSRQDTATPVRYGIVALVSNMILNLILIWHLKHAGLALATSISAFINAGLLWYGLGRAGVLIKVPGWAKFAGQVIIASVAMCVVLVLLTPEQQRWFEMAFWERFGAMLLICIGGVVTYAAFLFMSGFRPRQMVR
ncbi:MAG: murein biosynthesis integral membrane protein MurJ [Pseudomonadales bacterium]